MDANDGLGTVPEARGALLNNIYSQESGIPLYLEFTVNGRMVINQIIKRATT